MKAVRNFVLGITAVGTLGACGGSSTSANQDANQKMPATTESLAEFNDADVMFAQMMIPHHEQAIEMADIALDPITQAGTQVKDLATRIRNAQDPEILTMTGFLKTWGKSTAMDSSTDHSEMMSGMLTADQLSALSARRASDFDREWMSAMIAHHEGAIEMANDVVRDGKNSAVRDLANAIVSAQDAEIMEMKDLLGS